MSQTRLLFIQNKPRAATSNAATKKLPTVTLPLVTLPLVTLPPLIFIRHTSFERRRDTGRAIRRRPARWVATFRAPVLAGEPMSCPPAIGGAHGRAQIMKKITGDVSGLCGQNQINRVSQKIYGRAQCSVLFIKTQRECE